MLVGEGYAWTWHGLRGRGWEILESDDACRLGGVVEDGLECEVVR